MSTDEIPELPSREQELKYMKFLEKSISTDPWLSIKGKKYMANPWRLTYKSQIGMRKEYRKCFLINFFSSIFLSSPIIFYLANKRRYTSTGVPMTRVLPHDAFNPYLKVMSKNKYTRRTFYYGIFKYGVLFGIVGAFLTTDGAYLDQGFNARPDLNQLRAMTDYVKDDEKRAFNFFNGVDYPDVERPTILKRIKHALFPSVDYQPNYLPYFDYKKGYFPDYNASSYYSN